ncbi:MAG TPA: hypothetical protein VFS43_16430 [Polyangiaceae bacterium]|nr:hypothetical protein [Polyangiaceae bacterium]
MPPGPPPPASAPAAPAPAAPPASAPAPAGSAGGSVYSTCDERVPAGAQRPLLRETFPATGLGGYVLWLEIEVEHGRGEAVLPEGFSFSGRGGGAEALARAGFTLPAPESGQAPSVEPAPPGQGPRTSSRVKLPLVALPKEPGRVTLTLPPLPVAVSRASGEVTTVCTAPHVVTLEEPTASAPEARPKPNPPPRRQREHWQAAETAAGALLATIVGLVAGFLLYRWWSQRPRPEPPPPPPRPVWEVAIEDLALLRTGPLFTEGRHAELVARVSAVLRRYLGERYGFEGLEATSKEIRRALRRVFPPLTVLAEIDKVLDETDLVKFARVAPSEDDCVVLCELADRVVRATIPAAVAAEDLVPPPPRPTGGPGP